MNKIIVSNMKMNLNINEILEYLNHLDSKKLNNIIFCPTSIYLSFFISKGLNTGIQNISLHEKGPYTGEVSILQAKSLGVKYAIIGHSEIRKNLFDNNKIINEKLKLCIKNNIIPILCIGEEKEENVKNILTKQLNECLIKEKIKKLIIAYEPTWSIGTNNLPNLHQIDNIISFIKNFVKQNYDIDDIIVIYGGSINKNNIEDIININSLDGVLIGNASVNIKEFLDLLEVALY